MAYTKEQLLQIADHAKKQGDINAMNAALEDIYIMEHPEASPAQINNDTMGAKGQNMVDIAANSVGNVAGGASSVIPKTGATLLWPVDAAQDAITGELPFFAPEGESSIVNALTGLGREALALPALSAYSSSEMVKGTPNKKILQGQQDISNQLYAEPASKLEAGIRYLPEKALQAIGAIGSGIGNVVNWGGNKAINAYYGDPSDSTGQMNKEIAQSYSRGTGDVIGPALTPMAIAKGLKMTAEGGRAIANADLTKKAMSYGKGEAGADARAVIDIKNALKGGGTTLSDVTNSVENYQGLNRTPSIAEIDPDATLAAIQGNVMNAHPEMFSPNMAGGKSALVDALRKHGLDEQARGAMATRQSADIADINSRLPNVPYGQVANELNAPYMDRPISLSQSMLGDESAYTDFPAKYDVSGGKILKTSDLTGQQQHQLHATLNNLINENEGKALGPVYMRNKEALSGALGVPFMESRAAITEASKPLTKANYFNDIREALVPNSGKLAESLGNDTGTNINIGNAQRVMNEGIKPENRYGQTLEQWLSPDELTDSKAIARAMEDYGRAYNSGSAGGTAISDTKSAGVSVPTKIGSVKLNLDKGQQKALARLLRDPDYFTKMAGDYQKKSDFMKFTDEYGDYGQIPFDQYAPMLILPQEQRTRKQ